MQVMVSKNLSSNSFPPNRCDPMAIPVVQHIRRMRGGTQSHLMLGGDGHLYVVKFQNNPQHIRALANEWLGTHIAKRIGLPVPECAIVKVERSLIEEAPDLHVQISGTHIPCVPGLQFGSRFVIHPIMGQVINYLDDAFLTSQRVRNLNVLFGALAFDKWTCQADARQVIYWRRSRERKFTVSIVDQGHCFNGGYWTFPDSPLQGNFPVNQVYERATGWESFQPWLDRIEKFAADELWRIVETAPPEWYAADRKAMEVLVAKLLHRRSRVRELITLFRTSSKDPFPRWSSSRVGASR
jgi:hypothetical protein